MVAAITKATGKQGGCKLTNQLIMPMSTTREQRQYSHTCDKDQGHTTTCCNKKFFDISQSEEQELLKLKESRSQNQINISEKPTQT